MTVTTEVRESPLTVAGEWWNGMSRPERVALLTKLRESTDLPAANWRLPYEFLADQDFEKLPDGVALVILGTVQYKYEPAQFDLFLAPDTGSVN